MSIPNKDGYYLFIPDTGIRIPLLIYISQQGVMYIVGKGIHKVTSLPAGEWRYLEI